MIVLQVSDFIGRYLLAKNTYNVDVIQACINDFERKAIYDLLGVALGNEYINDLSGGVPQTPSFQVIHNQLSFDHCNKVHSSTGIKDYLLGIVYFHAITEARLSPSNSSGAIENQAEIGKVAHSRSEIYKRYNDSVDNGRTIQLYIELHLSDYEGFNGQRLLYNY